MAIRAAWLHYAGGLTQAAVAKRLGLPSVKAHRLIARAVAEGVVKVSIDGEIVECAALEDRLCRRFGLDYCEVAPDLGEEGIPLRALGMAGAGFLRRQIESGEHKVIGLGHGRTLAAAVRQLPRFDARDRRFVSLLGGLTRNYSANPHDVMHSLAAKTGALAHVLPVPFFANSEADRAILLAQPGVREIFDLSNGATLKFAGMGTVDAGAQLVASGMIEAREIAEINAAGGVGEILGHFFDKDGRVLDTMLSARTLAVDLDGPRGARIVAIAGGLEKAGAIRAVLKSRRLSGLITDEATARAVLADED
ncbi:MAG: sugar-binding transcriptional regulator [Paracoccus sp. (in: a-proteobacteria)]|uniref:sugar-binding transcriptional regulator n=1 Tax=Paracoccus sp. TaxID=267 RepID=UPI0039E5DFE4